MTAALITILPAEVPYEDTLTNGCLLTDSDVHFLDTHMRPKLTREWIEENKMNPIPLSEMSIDPLFAMKQLGIDQSLIVQAATYECPYIEKDFVSVIPTYLVTDNLSKYDRYKEGNYQQSTLDRMNDADWNLHWFSEEPQSNRFIDCLIGPGYTTGFLPSDGSSGYTLASFKLSNGDYLIVKTFTWFNK